MEKINFVKRIIAKVMPFRKELKERIHNWPYNYNIELIQQIERIKKFGKVYINTFPAITIGKYTMKIGKTSYESPIGIKLDIVEANSDFYTNVASLPLGFDKQTLEIRAIQGTAECKDDLDAFGRKVNTTWANYLVNKAIEHAKGLKFKQVKILRPQFNSRIERGRLHTPEKIRKLDALYYGVGKRFLFKKIKGEKFLVKDL